MSSAICTATAEPARSLEETMLLACARVQPGPEILERVQGLLREDLDWDRLREMARRHGVMPLLYRSVMPYSDAVPQPAMESLRSEFRANALRNLRLTRELIQLLKHLRAADVVALPLKGPALAELTYGDVALRQFVDLDILVRKRDVSRAMEVLGAVGYHLGAEALACPKALLKSMHHYALTRDGGHAPVELHWDFADRYFAFRMQMDALWERAETVTLAGVPTAGLCPEDVLLALSVHGSKHGWEHLGLICDVAELVRTSPAIQFGQALSRAAAVGGERMMVLGLLLANRLLDTPLPEEMHQRALDDPATQALAREVSGRLFSDEPPTPGTSERARWFRFHLAVRERLQDRLRCRWHLAFTPSEYDWASVRLPASLSFLYPVVRPLRLSAKYLARLRKSSD